MYGTVCRQQKKKDIQRVSKRPVHYMCFIVHCTKKLVQICLCYCIFHSLSPHVVMMCYKIMQNKTKTMVNVTIHFSGPERAGSQMSICMCTITVDLSNLWPRYLTCWFILTLSESQLKAMVICHSLQSYEENAASIVCIVLSKGFPVQFSYLYICRFW